MTVQLRSLRVDAQFDASSYTAGMQKKVAADKAGAASSREVGHALEQTDIKIGGAVNGLERLLRQTVAGYGASQRFETALRTLQRAFDTGNISIERAEQSLIGLHQRYGLMANATELAERGQIGLSAAAERANAAIAKQSSLASQAANSNRRLALAANDNTFGGAFQTANLAAQFQDIGVTTAMGMSPLQIALQQGTQLSAVLNTMERPVQGLAAAFMSVINPVSLVTIGVIAAGTALAQYFMSADEELNSLEAALKAHGEAIRALKDAYGEAASGVEEYLGLSREMARAATIIAGVQLRDRFREQIADLVNGGELVVRNAETIRQEIDRLKLQLGQAVEQGPYEALSKQLAEMERQFADVATGALAASGKFGPFRAEIEAFIATVQAGSPDLVTFRQAISERINAEPNNEALARMAGEILKLIDAAYGTQSAARASEGAMDTIGAAAIRNAADIDVMAGALRKLAGIAMPSLSNTEQAIAAFREGMSGAKTLGDLRRLDTEFSEAWRRSENQRLGAMVPTPTARPNDIEIDNWRFQAEQRAGRGAGGREKRVEYDRDLKSVRDRMEALQAERDSMDLTEAEAARLTVTRQLEAAAMRDSIGLSPDRVAEIRKEADAYAALVEELQRAEKAREVREFWRDTVRGFMDDLRGGLEQGQSFWEAFANAALRALDRIVDKILNEVLDALFQVNQAGGGGGGILGMLFGGLGSLFGGGVKLPGTAPIPTPRPFASGGFTGLGARDAIAGVVHGGEYVFSAAATARLGIGYLEQLHRTAKGYAEGGLVTPATMRMFAPGNSNGSTTVQIIDQRRGGTIEEERSTGPDGGDIVRLIVRDELDDFSRNRLPDRVAEIQRYPRNRG